MIPPLGLRLFALHSQRRTLACLVMVIILAGCSAVSSPSSSPTITLGPSSASPTATATLPTAAPLTSPEGTSAEHPTPARWQEATAPAVDPAGQFDRIFSLGNMFLLASGSQIWTSIDGWTWTQQADLGGSDGPQVAAVTAGGPGYVAVGSVSSGAAVWTSTDGLTWDRIPDSPALHGADMVAVTRGAHGLVAVGGSGTYNQPHAAVWTSPDARGWERAPDEPIFTRGTMEGVTAGGPGYVTVGGRFCATLCPEPGPLIWTSADGRSWRAVDPSSVVPTGPGIGWAVVKGPGALVEAVGMGGKGGSSAAVAWSTVDGVHWTSHFLGFADNGALAISPVGIAGFVAVAENIWGTADGRTWRSLSGAKPPEFAPFGSIACGVDRCVAVGRDLNNAMAAEVWVGPARVTP